MTKPHLIWRLPVSCLGPPEIELAELKDSLCEQLRRGVCEQASPWQPSISAVSGNIIAIVRIVSFIY
jgi:hypothetical protein